VTQEDAIRLFEYRDGTLYWRERPRSDFKTDLAWKQWNPKHAGKMAGCYSGSHATVCVNRKRYQLHRIIFLWHHGYLPEIVDHADCNPKNNQISNLRAASKADNQRNQGMYAHNTSGHKGVVWSNACQKWMARIKLHGTQIHLGVFANIEDAAARVMQEREKLHGSFTNHGLKGKPYEYC
jgi:hypothetical protein